MRRSTSTVACLILGLVLQAPARGSAAGGPTPSAPPETDVGAQDPSGFPRPDGLVRRSYSQSPGTQKTSEIATYHAKGDFDATVALYDNLPESAGWKETTHSVSGSGLYRVKIIDWEMPAKDAEVRFYSVKDGGTDLWVRVFTYPAAPAAAAAAAAAGAAPAAATIVTVPNVVGQPTGAAEHLLFSLEFKVLRQPERIDTAHSRDATVAEQDPAAGRKVPRGSAVTIVPWAATVRVPDVGGRPIDEAKAMLTHGDHGERFAVEVGAAMTTPNRNRDGLVAEQNPAADSHAPWRSTVTIVPWVALVPVPDVVGKTVAEARTTLTQGRAPAGHFAAEVGTAQPSSDPKMDGLVATQDPAAGTPAPMRSTVTLHPWSALVPVPNVVGRPVGDAKETLTHPLHGKPFAVVIAASSPTPDSRRDGTVAEQNPAGTLVMEGSTVTLTPWAALTPVPDMVGKPVEEARTTLTQRRPSSPHFAVEIGTAKPSSDPRLDGVVAAQDPAAGQPAPWGSTVTLHPWAALVPVPNLVGRRVDDAQEALTHPRPPGKKLAVVIAASRPTPDQAHDGTVAEQDPAAGTQVPANSTVTLTPWAGSFPVPDVIGKSASEARARLHSGLSGGFEVEFGLSTPTRDRTQNGTVADQQPAPGQTALHGSTVTLTLYEFLGP